MKNCPTQNTFSSFLTGAILADEREIFELHLAGCSDCRRNLALMFNETTENFVAPDSLKAKVKNLSAIKSKSKYASFFSFNWLKINRLQIGFTSVLLICLSFVGIYFLQNQKNSNSDDVLRNGSSKNDSFKLISPEDNADVSTETIEFLWTEMPKVKNYTLIISDEKGDIIKEISTEKPQIESAISELGLTKKKRYFWHVRVKFTDGTIAESENRKIFVR